MRKVFLEYTKSKSASYNLFLEILVNSLILFMQVYQHRRTAKQEDYLVNRSSRSLFHIVCRVELFAKALEGY